jgi:hypothetical protein
MRRVKPVGNLNAVVDHVIDGDQAGADSVRERASLQAFHHQERARFPLTDVVQRTNIGMIQRGGGARLPLKPLERDTVAGHRLRNKLHCDGAPQTDVFGLVHQPHPALAQRHKNLIMRDGLAEHGFGRAHTFCRL